MEENLALKHNETMCVENCVKNPEAITECQEECQEILTTCEQGCSAARRIASVINKTESDNAYYNCTGEPKPLQITDVTAPLATINFTTTLPTTNFSTPLSTTNFTIF